MVSSSGSPAATSEPKASTMIASVTGQESSSDFIIADLFAVLNSLQIAGEPVSETATDGLPARSSCGSSAPAAATIAVGSPFAPAVTTAVWPSAEMVAPGAAAARRRRARRRRARAPRARSACAERGRGGRRGRGVDDDRQRRARAPGEAPLDQRPGLHRLGAVRLPAGAGERRLDLRGERREDEGGDRPRDRRSPARDRPRSRRAGRSGRRSGGALDVEGRHARRRYGRRGPRSSGVRPIFQSAAIRPCFIANRLARARLETPIFA